MLEKTLLVLAAGMGSRYGGLKQLDGFGPHDETLLEYSVYDAIKAGFTHAVFVIREEFFDQFYSRFHHIFDGKIRVDYVFQQVALEISGYNFPERTKPRGTGQAILCAQHLIDNPFCVINADDYYGQDGYFLMSRFLDSVEQRQFGMVGYVLKNTLSPTGGVNRGVCLVNDLGLLVSVNEQLGLKKSGDVVVDENGEEFELDTIVSMNFWGFHQSFFDHIQHHRDQFIQSHRNNPKSEFYIPSVCDSCIRNYHLDCRVMISHDQWAGVTYPEDKSQVQTVMTEFIDNGKYPKKLR